MKVPIACTLSSADASDRVEEWRAVLGAAVRRVARPTPARAELRLVGEPGDIAKLVDLARREKACCGFFGFTFEVTAEGVTLVVTVPDEAVGVLDDFSALAAGTAELPSPEGISGGDAASTG